MRIYSRKKLNKFVSRPTTASELQALGKAMGLDVQVDRASNFNNLDGSLLILNTDPYGPGRHWVAVNKNTMEYFDPYAYDRLSWIPSKYKEASKTKQLQSIDGKNCGPLCLAWLASGNEIYKQLNDMYIG
jgi:hypothetical protein